MIAELSQRPLVRPDGPWRWRLSVGAKFSYPVTAALTSGLSRALARDLAAKNTQEIVKCCICWHCRLNGVVSRVNIWSGMEIPD